MESYTTLDMDAGSGTNGVDGLEHGPWTFDYINTGDIKFAIKVSSTWHFIDVEEVDTATKLVTLAAAPSASPVSADASSEGRIYRATTLTPLVDFQAGSRIAEADLDNAYRQGLFAAQEVAEDANTSGGSGTTTLGTGSVELSHMADNSVDSDQYVNGSIDTIHIADDAVGEPQLATTLDLSSHVVTLNATTLNLAGGNFGGILPEANGGTGLSAKPSGYVLECVTGPCVGKTQPAVDGGAVHTLPDAGTAGVALTSTYANIPGSVFQYRAPLEASNICYELNFSVAREGTLQAKHYAMFKLYIGANGGAEGGSYTEVPLAKFAVGGEHHVTRIHFKWTFPINDEDQYSGSGSPLVGYNQFWGADVSTQGTRHIKLMGREIINGSDIRHSKVNGVYLWDDSGTGSSDSLTENTAVFSCPVITVTAIK